MERTKETALRDFIEMIEKSWTWKRLTNKERADVLDRFSFETLSKEGAAKGSRKQRWAVYQAIYSAFLMGCGYKPSGWRETESAEPVPLF